MRKSLPIILSALILPNLAKAEFRVQIPAHNGSISEKTVQFGLEFEEKSLNLGEITPDSRGQYTIRIIRAPEDMANLDNLLLKVGGQTLKPNQVFDLSDKTDLLKKLGQKDWDVINAQGKTIEVRFLLPDTKAKEAILKITGREETLAQLKNLPGGACGYPSVHYTLGGNKGPVQLDGNLSGNDRWGKPVLKKWTEPISGHPDGFTYGYLKNDGRYLYGAIDFTSDNTFDGTEDYSAVMIKTDRGWRRFQVSVQEKKWGRPSFAYTDKVSYQHKTYEFKIPLSEIADARQGKKLEIAFLAYGTATCPTTANVQVGATNPQNTSVNIVGQNAARTLILHFTLEANESGGGGEGIEINSMIVTGVGEGNEANDIQAVELYVDVLDPTDPVSVLNLFDSKDPLVGTTTFNTNNGAATFTFNPPLNAGTPRSMFVVYQMKATAPTGATFTATLDPSNIDATSLNCPVVGGGVSVSSGILSVTHAEDIVTSGSIAAAPNAPQAGTVQSGQANVPMMQFTYTVGPEEELGSPIGVTVTGSGTGNEVTEIARVHIWADIDRSGTVTTGDIEVATAQSFTADNGSVTFNINDPGISAMPNATSTTLITYDFEQRQTASVWRETFRKTFLEKPYRIWPVLYPLSLTGCSGGGSGSPAPPAPSPGPDPTPLPQVSTFKATLTDIFLTGKVTGRTFRPAGTGLAGAEKTL